MRSATSRRLFNTVTAFSWVAEGLGPTHWANQSQLTVRVKNTGTVPSFMTQLDSTGVQRTFYATDKFTWLAPGETKDIAVAVWWRGPKDPAVLTVGAWNALVGSMKLF